MALPEVCSYQNHETFHDYRKLCRTINWRMSCELVRLTYSKSVATAFPIFDNATYANLTASALNMYRRCLFFTLSIIIISITTSTLTLQPQAQTRCTIFLATWTTKPPLISSINNMDPFNWWQHKRSWYSKAGWRWRCGCNRLHMICRYEERERERFCKLELNAKWRCSIRCFRRC